MEKLILAAVVLAVVFIIAYFILGRDSGVSSEADAKRFAELLASEIKLYNETKFQKGLENNNLCESRVEKYRQAKNDKIFLLMKNQVIQIYLLVCDIYDSQTVLKYQRASNFKPKFSDEEVITIYLFGQLNERFKHRQIYDFIADYWFEWFPDLPSYQAFNRRLNLLADNFQALFAHLLQTLHWQQSHLTADYLIDSMPIMLASGTRAKRARVAPEIAKIGFSAVKQTNFHGVRLHLIANKQTASLPLPTQVWLKEANVHDLTALKEISDELPEDINLFGDKAYSDETFKAELQNQQIRLLTPIKKPKKAELSKAQKRFNKTVSSFRQPIESFFKWLIDKTDIQRASQVRSTEGLIMHCLGKLTFALLFLNFYY